MVFLFLFSLYQTFTITPILVKNEIIDLKMDNVNEKTFSRHISLTVKFKEINFFQKNFMIDIYSEDDYKKYVHLLINDNLYKYQIQNIQEMTEQSLNSFEVEFLPKYAIATQQFYFEKIYLNIVFYENQSFILQSNRQNLKPQKTQSFFYNKIEMFQYDSLNYNLDQFQETTYENITIQFVDNYKLFPGTLVLDNNYFYHDLFQYYPKSKFLLIKVMTQNQFLKLVPQDYGMKNQITFSYDMDKRDLVIKMYVDDIEFGPWLREKIDSQQRNFDKKLKGSFVKNYLIKKRRKSIDFDQQSINQKDRHKNFFAKIQEVKKFDMLRPRFSQLKKSGFKQLNKSFKQGQRNFIPNLQIYNVSLCQSLYD